MSGATQTSGLGFVGQSVRRVEDERLLTGNGRFVADERPDGVLHASFVRSPHPHARIRSIDASAARALPGVERVIAGAEMRELTNPTLPLVMLEDSYTPLVWPLSDDLVRHVGDPVALVLAQSRAVAEDGAELVDVDYELLSPVADLDTALRPTTKPLWDHAESNVLMDHTYDYGSVAAVFGAADRTITETFTSHRQSNQPMETRGILVEVDPFTGHLTITSATQSPHLLKWAVAAATASASPVDSIKAIWNNRSRRASFTRGARDFLADSRESIGNQNPRSMLTQLRRDPSFLKHATTMSAGVLAADDYPTVTAHDIGGGFGAKGSVAREELAVAAAAKVMGRPVRWIADRSEDLLDGGQARDEQMTVRMAVDDDGTFRGLDVDLVLDQGAYPAFPIGAPLFASLMKVYLPGLYRWNAYRVRIRVVATNKGKYVPYRGPWANETWVRERMIDEVARKLGRNPTDLRLQNMLGDDDFPTTMITGPTLDVTASTRKTLLRALELVDTDAFERDRAAAEARGHRLGIGFACYHEAAPGPPDFTNAVNPGSDVFLNEDARVEIDVEGRIRVFTSQMPHGQSHQTTYSQIAADAFGVGLDDVEIVWGNTDRSEFSLLGTGGSRGGPIGGGAIRKTTNRMRERVIDEASRLLECNPDDVRIEDGNIHVAGVPARGIGYGDVAAAVADRERITSGPAMSVTESYGGKGDGGWSCATHVAVVDIDLETGIVAIPRYLVVEDCGPVINPAIVDGQVRGGVAQGVGAVFYECAAYDEAANMTATTYLDYLIPSLTEIPEIEIEHLETLSPGAENDFRGVGEGGMIGAPAALTNAVADALAPLGACVVDQHLPPTRILELAGIIQPD